MEPDLYRFHVWNMTFKRHSFPHGALGGTSHHLVLSHLLVELDKQDAPIIIAYQFCHMNRMRVCITEVRDRQ